MALSSALGCMTRQIFFNNLGPQVTFCPFTVFDIGTHGEFYTALSSSIVTLFSTVNRKKCIQQQMEYHAAIAANLRAIAAEHEAKGRSLVLS